MSFSSSPPKTTPPPQYHTSTRPHNYGSTAHHTEYALGRSSTTAQPAFYSPSAAALADRSPLPTPENDESSRVCACSDEHPSIVRTVQVVVPSAVRHHWYHTRFWFVVISPDEFDECCVAPRWYIYVYIVFSPLPVRRYTVLYVSPRYSPPCALAPNSRFGRRNRRKCFFCDFFLEFLFPS